MLQAIVSWSIQNRVAVVVLAVLLLGTGIYASSHAKLDVFPEFAPPQVVIQTEAPGLSAGEVEQLVTLAIEHKVNGLPRLDILRSQSIQGLSVVTLIFQDRADIYRARQQVAERLTELTGQLPAGVKAPKMEPLTSPTGRLLTVGFTSQKLSPLRLRDIIQWDIRPRLLAVKGVAHITMFGGEVRQFQVQIKPDYLAARRLTLTDVLDATRQASGIRGAGFLENDRQRVTLRVEGQVHSARELGEAVVARSEGTPVRLRDVADVVEGPEPKFGDATIDGERGVTLIVYKQLDSDTIEVTRAVENELDKLQPVLEQQGIDYHPGLFRQANFIQHAIGNVTQSLLIGAALVCVVLFLFLFNLRTAFISLTAIPLSLLSAVVVLWAWGVSLNTLTLGGLAIAVGEVVDDAIIDVENIFRRLRENARLGSPRSALAVVLSASLEVRTAVVYATFVVALVFVPVFFMSGLQGRLFAPLGYAYVLAVLASLVTALTVTPALSMLLLQARSASDREPPLLRWLQGGYDWLVRLLDREFALPVVVATLVLFVAAVAALFDCGGEFLPELRENHFVVHMRGLPGTSLPQSMAAGNRLNRELRADPELSDGLRSICQLAGRAELGEDTWGVEYSEFEVDLKRLEAEDAEKVERRLKHKLSKDFAGFSFEVLPFLSERIKETLSGSTAAVAVKIYGDDLAALDVAALQVARELGKVKGHANVRIEPQTGVPELAVRARGEDAAPRGLRKAHILDAVHAAYQGAEIGQVYDRNRVIDLVVLLEPVARIDAETVANLWISLPPPSTAPGEVMDASDTALHQGVYTPRSHPAADAAGSSRVQLKQVADIYLSDGRFLIAHEGGTRRQQVTCNVKGRDVESFVEEAEARVGQLELPEGTYYTFTGEHEARRTAQRDLFLLSLLSVLGILLLLWMAFGSLLRMLLVLVNVLFALVGGVAAVYLAGGFLDVGSLVGFVTLFGITTRNSIMMVSHWQHLHEVEGMAWGPELVYRGARERLAPVLMTALVTALGLLPIALGSGEAGREIEGPMAQVILGGLVTSTGLNLCVLPILYRRFGTWESLCETLRLPAPGS